MLYVHKKVPPAQLVSNVRIVSVMRLGYDRQDATKWVGKKVESD